MSYIDAFLERDKDRINVVERVDGKRFYKTYPTRYMFYYNDRHYIYYYIQLL